MARTVVSRSLALAAVVVGLASLSVASAQSPPPSAPARGNCGRCHELAKVMPTKHPQGTGTTLGTCLACHKPAPRDPGPNAFAARMHRAHVRAGADCTTCHVFRAGQQFSLVGSTGNLGALTPDEYDRVRKVMAAWIDSPYLAGLHGARQNLTCTACHAGQLIPDDNERVLNTQCVTCHGSGAEMAVKTRNRHGNINVHESHLGNIACTVCHQGHAESKAYCVTCHTNFDLKIPGGATAAGR
jgi:Cytochrome c3